MSAVPPTIGDLGEFTIIDRIRSWIDRADHPRDPTIRVGIGDDVAVTSAPADSDLLLTCDVQVAGRHFVAAWMTPEEIGRRAFEVCASDLAAKGGRPLWVLASLGLPPSFRCDHLECLYRGMLAGLGDAGSGRIVGGNLTSTATGPWFLDLTMIGAVARGRAPLRSGARVGDSIFVSGTPGAAAAGLELLSAGAPITGLADTPGTGIESRATLASRSAPGDRWVRAYCAPRARLALGSSFVASGLVHAMLDTSDGLLGDLFHVCEASAVAAELDLEALALPPETFDLRSATTRDLLASLGIEPAGLPWRWILGPSDDYELLCTAPTEAGGELVALARRHDVLLREVGRVVAGAPGIRLRGAGHDDSLPWTPQCGDGKGGFDHFGRPGA